MPYLIAGILAAVAGHFSNAFAAVADKYLLKQAFREPAAYTFWIGVVSMLVFVLLPFDFALPQTTNQWFTDLVAGVTFSMALFFYFTTIKRSDVSSAIPVVGSLVAIFTAAIAYVYLQERLSVLQLLGIAVLVVALWVLASERLGIKLKAIETAAVAALLFAISSIAMKVVFFNQPFISGLAFSRLGSLLVSVVLLAFPVVRRALTGTVSRFTLKNLVILGLDHLAGSLGFVLLNLGVKFSSPTIVNSLQGVQYGFVFLIVLAARPFAPAVFNERFGRSMVYLKVLGIVLVTVGITLIARP